MEYSLELLQSKTSDFINTLENSKGFHFMALILTEWVLGHSKNFEFSLFEKELKISYGSSEGFIQTLNVNDFPLINKDIKEKFFTIKQKDLKDCFVEKASGFSGTYNDLLPKFRIDYIFASQSINFLSYEQNVYDYSDHNPVFARFELK